MQALPRLRCAPAGAQLAAPRRAARAPRRLAQSRRRVARVRAVLSEPSAAELAAESVLREGLGDIVGIPRSEWLRLQAPARYLGNEWGAVHKPWGDASIRFALAYPEVRSPQPPASPFWVVLTRRAGVRSGREQPGPHRAVHGAERDAGPAVRPRVPPGAGRAGAARQARRAAVRRGGAPPAARLPRRGPVAGVRAGAPPRASCAPAPRALTR